MEKSDRKLISEFLESESDRAFGVLVQRHAGMVFGAALRVTRDKELAEDTAQMVFAVLLRKANSLADHPCLAAWLHKSATLEAARLMRKERNHRKKLQSLASSESATAPHDGEDHPALEHLDEAMAQLRTSDRRLLMLRFYQGYKLRELAPALGKSEVAVRKQSERAISRLSTILRKRGVVLPATALTGMISDALVAPAHADLVTSITHQAAANSAALSTSTLALNTLHTMSQGKLVALSATAVALLAAVPIGIQTQRLNETNIKLQQAQTSQVPAPSRITRSKTKAPAVRHSEPNSLREQAANSATTDAEFLRNLLTRQLRPRHEEIAAFIGKNRSLEELRSMFDKVVELPLTEHQRSALQKLVSEIARHDGPYAIELAMGSIKASKLRHHALRAAYAGWGEQDPEAAWAYANALPPEQLASHPYWQITIGAAQGDLSTREFYDFVESNSTDLIELSGGHLWQALAFIYDHKDSGGMPNWVEGLPDGHLKNLASSQLVQQWSLSDPTAAKTWMESNVDPHKNADPTHQLAIGWAQVDPQSAMDWLTSLPPDLQTQAQFSGALEKWLSYDQVGAATWLAAAEPSPLLDIPFERYVYRVRHSNPPEAMNWATSITNSERRLNMMKKVAEVWKKKDPAALEQFIASDPAGASLLDPTK